RFRGDVVILDVLDNAHDSTVNARLELGTAQLLVDHDAATERIRRAPECTRQRLVHHDIPAGGSHVGGGESAAAYHALAHRLEVVAVHPAIRCPARPSARAWFAVALQWREHTGARSGTVVDV